MNAIQHFIFEEHQVRVLERFEEPWFIAVDVCKVLGLRNARDAVAGLDDDEKDTVANTDGIATSRVQSIKIISLPGLFSLVAKSRKPVARAFDRWVRHVVLMEIYKTGSFSLDEAEPAPLAIEPLPVDRRQALAEVKEARLIFGTRAARALWASSPYLPRVAEMEATLAIQDHGWSECLSHLLSFLLEDGMQVRDLIIDALGDQSEPRLRMLGIYVDPEDNGFCVAINPRCVNMIFEGTNWKNGQHVPALRQIIGSYTTKKIKFPGNITSAAIFVPRSALGLN